MILMLKQTLTINMFKCLVNWFLGGEINWIE